MRAASAVAPSMQVDRFWSNVAKSDDCWVWTGYIMSKGYGRYGKKPSRMAHRIAYELVIGPIPDDLTLDHLCKNRACVNPEHLEPVTRAVNTMRGTAPPVANAVKTHCPRGHAYDEANTFVRDGKRRCRECDRRSCRAARERRRLRAIAS